MEKEFYSLWSACSYKYYEGSDIKEGKVGGAWGANGGNLKKGDHLEEQGLGGMYILKCFLKKHDGPGPD